MKTLVNSLLGLIEVARALGLNENDLKNAKDYLVHNEYGLCFDTIITQMYEYDLEIDNSCYDLITAIGRKMDLQPESYLFMRELIRDEHNIPKPVKDELAKILSSIK